MNHVKPYFGPLHINLSVLPSLVIFPCFLGREVDVAKRTLVNL